jgi:hypothetical protein
MFWENFTADKKKSEEFDEDQQGQFETFGPDFDYVLKVFKETPQRVWTVIDPDGGDWDDSPIVVNGLRYCDRIYYIVTQENGSEGDTYRLY